MSKRMSIMQQLRADARNNLDSIKHDLTRKQYIRDSEKFLRYCREQHKVRTLDECKTHLQDYSDFLLSQGYTASTIHTYLSASCKALGLNQHLAKIQKPLRRSAEFVRGRQYSKSASKFFFNDAQNERYKTLLAFQNIVGIRRAELAKLKGSDLVYDESNYLCVRVRKGKGGKMQLQRIHPANYQFVKSVFQNKDPEELIFPAEIMKNKLNLHSARAQCARDAYCDYVYRIKNEQGYDKILEAEILARWNKYNLDPKTNLPKLFKFEEIRGEYHLRGANRKFAIEHNLPVSYNKLCVMATSMFVLSHYRNNVTISSYLLAI